MLYERYCRMKYVYDGYLVLECSESAALCIYYCVCLSASDTSSQIDYCITNA